MESSIQFMLLSRWEDLVGALKEKSTSLLSANHGFTNGEAVLVEIAFVVCTVLSFLLATLCVCVCARWGRLPRPVHRSAGANADKRSSSETDAQVGCYRSESDSDDEGGGERAAKIAQKRSRASNGV